MIKGINIKNFRCYNNSTIEGFKRINLIGGLNNSGKTILLEAILLNTSPTGQNISLLKQSRGESMKVQDLPEYTWDNFFFNQNKDNEIEITALDDNSDKDVKLIISCDNKADVFLDAEKEIEDEDENLQTVFNDFITNDKILKSVLHIKYSTNNTDLIDALTIVSHPKGFTVKELKIPSHADAQFIPASSKRKPAILARDFGIAEKRNEDKRVLEALQIVDSNIEDIRVNVVGGAHLEIKRKNENFMPVSLFGDAINKILTIILTLVNNKNTILLIDEIENGLHYTVQEKFWKFLFELSFLDTFNNQIFATTHSLEMIKAFTKVGLSRQDECAYFELFYRENIDTIDYNSHDIETFNYEISNNLPVRGE